MSDDALGRTVDAAMRPMLVSLAPWGVDECHWLAAPDGEPAVWIRTRTAVQRVALESQVWLPAQVQMLLTRVGVPYETVSRLRIRFSSVEEEQQLFDE